MHAFLYLNSVTDFGDDGAWTSILYDHQYLLRVYDFSTTDGTVSNALEITNENDYYNFQRTKEDLALPSSVDFGKLPEQAPYTIRVHVEENLQLNPSFIEYTSKAVSAAFAKNYNCRATSSLPRLISAYKPDS
jgi:hypothetical protein